MLSELVLGWPSPQKAQLPDRHSSQNAACLYPHVLKTFTKTRGSPGPLELRHFFAKSMETKCSPGTCNDIGVNLSKILQTHKGMITQAVTQVAGNVQDRYKIPANGGALRLRGRSSPLDSRSPQPYTTR